MAIGLRTDLQIFILLQDSSKQFTAVKSQLQKLQQQLWDREKENVQLQFQYEQAIVDLPRLQVSSMELIIIFHNIHFCVV